ncbi:F-box family protein [Rhynchospora pubera]|uniref:F-box family protein n=1 Tax=Rhynchospora pubera TaxID=906938 RepID=A0AAV8DPT8_9POAL|nr:F-box family protein [Rhynchospora pubera]
MANWSELPADVLKHIIGFLPIQDYHRFSAVCRYWGMVAKERRHSPAQQIPWLAMGELEDTKKRKFYDVLEARHYYLDVPELRGTVLCGSSYGWLFTLDRELNFRLVNPLTGECYDLPRPPPFNKGHVESEIYLRAEQFMQRYLVIKGILDYDPRTRSDFTALILYGASYTPAFWRVGHTIWTTITGIRGGPDDITFFEGKFYFLGTPCTNSYSKFYTFEVGTEPKATKLELQVPCNGDPNYIIEDLNHNCTMNYLVVFGGKLHLVERFLEMYQRRLTTEFVLHELDLERNKYSTCQHINGHTIFLGASASVVISPSPFTIALKMLFTSRTWHQIFFQSRTALKILEYFIWLRRTSRHIIRVTSSIMS